MTNPIETGQIVLGLKIRGFEMCDFSLHVIAPTSKDMTVKYIGFFYCIYVYICRKKAEIKKNINICYKKDRQLQMSSLLN